METFFYTPKLSSSHMFKSYYVVWKLSFSVKPPNLHTSLNRTMQYGNLSLTEALNPHLLRLNRTMQYGNLAGYFLHSKPLMAFKSYYVVWKPAFSIAASKSTRAFKSYYVVWKLFCTSTSSSFFFGLNRTMQYGNKKLFKFEAGKKEV